MLSTSTTGASAVAKFVTPDGNLSVGGEAASVAGQNKPPLPSNARVTKSPLAESWRFTKPDVDQDQNKK